MIMKVTVNSKKGLKTNLSVLISKETVNDKINEKLKELSKTVNLKGFRPGKVPSNVIKSQFGKAIYGEVLEKILQETSAQAIKEKNIKIAGHPKLDLKSHGEGKDLNYTLEIDELPVIKIKPLENIKFIDYEINVDESEIKKRISEIAKNQNNFKEKKENEKAENGDLVAFDYEATVENKSFEGGKGKNTQIVLGKDLFIKGFDKGLVGSKKNEEKIVICVLPENYPKKEYANQKASFKCKILTVKKPETVNVDDAFAKNLGAKDLNDLKLLISKQIQNQYKNNLESISKESILEQIEKINDIDLPSNLIEQELSLITKGLKKEDLEKNKKNNEKIAKKRIKLGLLLNELGEKNNLKVNDQEFRNEIQKQAQSMPGQEKQVLEYYQKNPSAADSIKGSLYEEKIINLIKQKAKKTKKIVSLDEADKILKLEHDKRHAHDHGHKHTKDSTDETGSKKPKKLIKSSVNKKKIRNK